MATLKQKKAALEKVKILKGESNIKTGGEMLEKVGYSKGIAKTPSRVLESKGFLDEFDKLIPDSKLIEVHNEGLNAIKKEHKIVDRDKDGKPIYDFVDVEDYSVRHKYLDTAYKIKGSYAPEKSQSVNLNLNTEIKNSKQSRELVDEYEAKLAKMLKEPKNDVQK